VPSRFIAKEVFVRAVGQSVAIYADDVRIAERARDSREAEHLGRAPAGLSLQPASLAFNKARSELGSPISPARIAFNSSLTDTAAAAERWRQPV
jgi:hypothetical protein